MHFRDIPQIDKIINDDKFKDYVKPILAYIAKNEIASIRQKLQDKKDLNLSQDDIFEMISKKYDKFNRQKLQKVINATGVVVHTNLGRSLISEEIFDSVKNTICHASNLEYDLQNGKRGERYTFISNLASILFGCEDVLVVNNNASAVFLVLNTLAKNKEVIVSRGELVEIGGSFRVPEVMLNSGAILKEIGTTNRTKIQDYENAINENTGLLLKVHRSNFDIVGFTKSASLQEISALAKDRNLPSYYDLGSGYLGELPYCLSKDEPSLDKIANSVDLLSFSGDKLFGSVQCGIILGKKKYINQLKKNQLLRMLRVDKITLSILNLTMFAYLNHSYNQIPTLNLLNTSEGELVEIGEFIIDKVGLKDISITKTNTYVGGGTMPNKKLPSIAVALDGNAINLERKFRDKNVIGRIEDDKFMLDLRSVLKSDINELVEIIKEVLSDE
ncbi:L-seryl-tRNA(Sec) selenium transferase [Campylobacter sputorum]|uniref:L-seryl-tRNA(Sec) selenium transferase n=1 Tax=Campylobacter sputorum TaxID=206 RepID=UPI0018797DC5|nr:L-seryl-tRNA(Sec) selenium transferase [Campylobacter sp. RM11302]MBE7357919.1 L-seryl-tRNA(Sec) selenium transferase [Campylobacter sp. RM11302]